jgi:hypothetical protein
MARGAGHGIWFLITAFLHIELLFPVVSDAAGSPLIWIIGEAPVEFAARSLQLALCGP